MKNCKVRLEDRVQNLNFEKEGDFGLVAIAQNHGKFPGPDVEVDFSSLNQDQLTYLLSTILKIAYNHAPQAVLYSLVLFQQAVKAEKGDGKPVVGSERSGVLEVGSKTDKSKTGGTDKGSSNKN